MTLETVATETPANFATSRIVATSSPLNMVIDYNFKLNQNITFVKVIVLYF